MEYKNYPARILIDLYDALQNEATNQGRSVNKQLEAILKERYHAHAPPIPTKSRSANGSTSASKVKTKATT